MKTIIFLILLATSAQAQTFRFADKGEWRADCRDLILEFTDDLSGDEKDIVRKAAAAWDQGLTETRYGEILVGVGERLETRAYAYYASCGDNVWKAIWFTPRGRRVSRDRFYQTALHEWGHALGKPHTRCGIMRGPGPETYRMMRAGTLNGKWWSDCPKRTWRIGDKP